MTQRPISARFIDAFSLKIRLQMTIPAVLVPWLPALVWQPRDRIRDRMGKSFCRITFYFLAALLLFRSVSASASPTTELIADLTTLISTPSATLSSRFASSTPLTTP